MYSIYTCMKQTADATSAVSSADFDEAVRGVRQLGVPVKVKVLSWGTIGVIVDPEGNRIELKAGKQ